MTRAIVLAVAVAATVAHAGDRKYTLAELKTLVGQGAYKEAYAHLGDLGPSERTADWLDVAGATCGGVLATAATDDGSTLALIDQIDGEFPQLRKTPKYMTPRAELGAKGLEGCFAQAARSRHSRASDDCIRAALRFVDNASDDRALALRVAKLVRGHASSAAAVPFVTRALAGKDRTACKDDDAKLAVIAGLGLAPDDATTVAAKALMTTCWSALEADIVKAFEADANGGYVQRNTCATLVAKKLLSPLQAKVCARP